MKKRLVSIFVVLFLLSGVYAQSTTELSYALDGSARDISSALPVKSKIAVATFFSDSKDMSSYLIQEMTRRLMQNGLLTVLERSDRGAELLDAEMMYQYSGAVDDDSMVGLGKRFGAQYLVYGSFEQYGGMLQFTVQVTNVESGEIPYLKSYSISKNSQITDLLGDDMELNNAEDYLDAIARCQRKITVIEKDKSKAIQNQTSRIFSVYQEQINTVRAEEKAPWESKSEYEMRIRNAVSEIEKKRDTELSGVKDAVGINYDNQSKQVEIQQETLIKDLQNITFSLRGASVQVMLGAFDAESKPKGWPVNVKSLDKLVAYSYSGKYAVNDADVKTEYQTVENARSYDGFEGEISYRIIEGYSKSTFNVYVVNVRVYIKTTGSTIVNESINKVVGQVVANKTITGSVTEDTSSSQKEAGVNISDITETDKIAENTSSANSGSVDSNTGSKSSSVASASNVEKTKPVWVTNDFIGSLFCIGGGSYHSQGAVGYRVEIEQSMDSYGISVSAFSSVFKLFYVNWLNVDLGFYPDFYSAISIDAGLYLPLFSRFFPFVELGGGICFNHVNHYYESEITGREDYSGERFGFLGKIGLGFDVKVSETLKIKAELDFPLLSTVYNSDDAHAHLGSAKVGVAYGKPVK